MYIRTKHKFYLPSATVLVFPRDQFYIKNTDSQKIVAMCYLVAVCYHVLSWLPYVAVCLFSWPELHSKGQILKNGRRVSQTISKNRNSQNIITVCCVSFRCRVLRCVYFRQTRKYWKYKYFRNSGKEVLISCLANFGIY